MKSPKRPSFSETGSSAFLRWELAAIGLVMLVLVAVALLPERQAEMGTGRVIVYGSLILLGALLVAFWVLRGRSLASRLHKTETDLLTLQERMGAIFRLSHRFAHAQSENDIITIVLQMCIDVVNVKGAVFVPLDPRGHPMPTQISGDLTGSEIEVWAEHLAVSQARDQCAACLVHEAVVEDPCPLLAGVPSPDIDGVHCFPLRRGDQNFGMLNLLMAGSRTLDPEALAFLSAMMDEMGIAIEAIRLRGRDLAKASTHVGLEQVGTNDLLRKMVDQLVKAVDVPFAHLCVYQNDLCSRDSLVNIGNPPARVLQLLEDLSSKTDVEPGEADQEIKLDGGEKVSFLVFPLKLPDEPQVGKLILMGPKERLISSTTLAVCNAVSEQIAITARYTQLVQALEYQVVMDERARLAREIHDGMAQTLGFLKLLGAQLQSNLAKGDSERLDQLVQMNRSTLAEAYVDARQAIDGLRITPVNGFSSWVLQAAEDFSENTGLRVTVETEDFPKTVPPEVQAQLIRIVQEALTNIRKHSGANQVRIKGGVWQGDLILEIGDNGTGFEPEDVMRPSRHGLKGMQERAELVEAEFQVISQPGQGTTVRVRLPASAMELSS